jgi:hypothetical protein
MPGVSCIESDYYRVFVIITDQLTKEPIQSIDGSKLEVRVHWRNLVKSNLFYPILAIIEDFKKRKRRI